MKTNENPHKKISGEIYYATFDPQCRVCLSNKSLSDLLATSINQAVAEAEKKLLRTLLTECDRTENEGGRLLLTNYKLKAKK